MSLIEDQLYEEKERLNRLTAPEDMEARLRIALSTAAPGKTADRKLSGAWKLAAAAVLAVMLVGGNQYHALAYYGKTLLGFDGVVNGTLDKLNQQGWGQALGEQVQLADGTLLTVDGIMSDENQLIVYYTLSHPSGLANGDTSLITPIGIKGYRTDSHMQSGSSGPSQDRTEIKGIFTFDPVSPFAKKLTLSYWDESGPGSERHQAHLTFSYHPDEAMPTQIKQSIRQTLTTDDGSISFGSITATPTMTLIEGTLQEGNPNLLDQVINGVELVANGDQVKRFRSDAQRSQNGYTFTLRYESLPEKLDSMQLVLKEHGGKVEIPMK